MENKSKNWYNDCATHSILNNCTRRFASYSPIAGKKGQLSSTIGCLVQFNTVGRRQRLSLFVLPDYQFLLGNTTFMNNEKVWKKVLSPSEEIKYEFSIADKYRMVSLWVFCILGVISIFSMFSFLAVPFFILGIFYFGFYLRVANIYAFTNKRVLIHRGWLSTSTVSVDYDKITDVTVVENFSDRIISQSGHIAINTAGSIGDEIILRHVAHPYEIKKKLDQLR